MSIAVYPTGKQAVGVGVETAPGTPNSTIAAWVPLTKFDWNDKITWLEDQALRGSMAKDSYAVVQGVEIGEITMEGPAYMDTLPYFVANILGDVTTTGTATTPTGTLAAASVVGATSVSSTASIPSGTLIQIDTGNLAEVVTTSGAPTGTGPYTIPVPALTKPHAGPTPGPAAAVTAIVTTGPQQHAISLMNSGQGRGQGTNSAQPSTLTISQYYGPAAGSGGRQFTSVVFTEIGLKWNAESEFLTWTGKAIAWVSAIPVSLTSPIYSTAQPIASWRGVMGLAGPASGGTQVMTVETGEYTLTRTASAKFTGQNSQNPYIIARGDFKAAWKNSFIAADESPLLYARNNTQPQHQFIASNGQSGANALAMQVDMQQAAFTEPKANYGKELIGWDATGKAVLNTVNAGYTGGYSPIKLTFTNAVAAGSYV